MALEFAEWAHSLVDAKVYHTLDSVGRVGCGVVPKLKLALFLVCLVCNYSYIAALLVLVLWRDEI